MRFFPRRTGARFVALLRADPAGVRAGFVALLISTATGLIAGITLGKIELKRGGADTVVAWSDELSVGANPVWRWLAFAMDGIRTSNVNKGLAALKQVAEHDRAPAA